MMVSHPPCHEPFSKNLFVLSNEVMKEARRVNNFVFFLERLARPDIWLTGYHEASGRALAAQLEDHVQLIMLEYIFIF